MSGHLRYAGRPHEVQRAALENIVRGEPVLMRVLEGLRRLDVPDALVCSGALYNTVWNVLTGWPALAGIKDIDIAYFDPDLSYEAEDRMIRRLQACFDELPIPIEVRNQARVHLWFEKRFGLAYPALAASAEMLLCFASKTHAVAVRLDAAGTMAVFAPFGLDDLFSFRITPNYRLDNRETHEEKGRRAVERWPEATLEPWVSALFDGDRRG